MGKLQVLKEFLANPKEIITEGFMAVNRKRNRVDYEQLAVKKFGKDRFPTIDLLELMPNMHETLTHYSFLAGTSLVTDIALLRGLARRFNNCSYMEIGSFRGESVVAVSGVAADCTALTLSKQEMIDMGFPQDHIDASGIYLSGEPNIKSVLHNSLTFDFSTLNKKFDLIFVDGDHSYDAVVSDTKNVLKLLKDDNSIIVWHDYSFDTANVRHEIMAAIAEGMPKELHKHLYQVSNTMCAVFMKGNFNAKQVVDNVVPNKVFSLDVTARSLKK